MVLKIELSEVQRPPPPPPPKLHGKFVLPTWNAVIIISYIIRVHCKHENALAKGDGEVAGMYYNL